MKAKEETTSTEKNETNDKKPSPSKDDEIKQKLIEKQKIYSQMIELRAQNLDPFKKIDMSKFLKYFTK